MQRLEKHRGQHESKLGNWQAQLGNIQVSSVSKKKERLADTAASIYVITEEAIRRSGARTLPDALALAPNLLVAQINASQYAISARGFNSGLELGWRARPAENFSTSLVDARYGWRIRNNVELAISGRNLLNARQQAFASGSGTVAVNPIQLERSYKLSITRRF